METFSFTATAKDARTVAQKKKHGDRLEILAAWTDGVSLSTEHEPGWPPAFRLKKGSAYRITVEEV